MMTRSPLYINSSMVDALFKGMWVVSLFLLVLTGSESLRIITRGMIRGPGVDPPIGKDRILQPVILKSKEEAAAIQQQQQSATQQPDNELPLARNLEEIKETTTTQKPIEITTKPAVNNNTKKATTKLYPIARLWTDTEISQQKTDYNIWGLLHTAYLCLFSGMDCFSRRVVPMFKSYLGYPEFPTTFLLPRDRSMKGPRSIRTRKYLKELVLILIVLKLFLLPWLGGLSLASGKALLTGLLGLGAAGAVVWEDHRRTGLF